MIRMVGADMRIIATLIVVFGLAIILVYAVAKANEAAADRVHAQANLAYERGRAEAVAIRAAGQARLDAAQASQMVMVAALPWGVIGLLGILGLSLSGLAVALVVMSYTKAMQPPPVLERHIVFLPNPDAPRRETWQLLSDKNPYRLVSNVKETTEPQQAADYYRY